MGRYELQSERPEEHLGCFDLQVAHQGATSLPVAEPKAETLSLTVQEMKRMPSVVSMFNSMNLAPQARILLEQAVANVAA